MKELLIRILFKLLDVGKVQIDEDAVVKWLSEQYGHPGFRQYIALRNKNFLRELGGGEGLQGEPRLTYNLHIGQRFELLRLAHQTKLAHNKLKKK